MTTIQGEGKGGVARTPLRTHALRTAMRSRQAGWEAGWEAGREAGREGGGQGRARAHQVLEQALWVPQVLRVGQVEAVVLEHVLQVGLEAGRAVVVKERHAHVPVLPRLRRLQPRRQAAGWLVQAALACMQAGGHYRCAV